METEIVMLSLGSKLWGTIADVDDPKMKCLCVQDTSDVGSAGQPY